MTGEEIFPFLWMREGDTDKIEEEIQKIVKNIYIGGGVIEISPFFCTYF